MAHQQPNLRHLPLHVVADILCGLESMDDLKSAMISHPIFTNAFNTYRSPILINFILGSVSPLALPFALCLQEAKKAKAPEDVRALIATLNFRRRDPDQAKSALYKLCGADLQEMSTVCKAVSWLAEDFFRDSMPVFKKYISPSHSDRPSTMETFRVQRALYRYGMFCTIFCDTERSNGALDGDECHVDYFHNFSPWVNEEFLCVYQHLRRKLGSALSDMFAHDIAYEEIARPDFTDCREYEGCLDALLCWGLPRIQQVCKGKSYDDYHILLKRGNIKPQPTAFAPWSQFWGLALLKSKTTLKDLDYEPEPVNLSVCRIHPRAWETIRRKRDIDRTYGPEISDSERAWLLSNRGTALDEVLEYWFSSAAWQSGYVCWDYPDREAIWSTEEQREVFEEQLFDLRQIQNFYESPEWSEEDVRMSMEQRSEIQLHGGTGYWKVYQPGHGTADFSRITGLDEDVEKGLVEKWNHYYTLEWMFAGIE